MKLAEQRSCDIHEPEDLHSSQSPLQAVINEKLDFSGVDDDQLVHQATIQSDQSDDELLSDESFLGLSNEGRARIASVLGLPANAKGAEAASSLALGHKSNPTVELADDKQAWKPGREAVPQVQQGFNRR